MTDYYHFALIAHDAKKLLMVELVKEFEQELTEKRLVTTSTTGALLEQETLVRPTRLLSGPKGGDLQIGALVATGKIRRVVFLRDPLSAHPHEPDIVALMKVCDVYDIPLATNAATARLLFPLLWA